MDVVILLVFGVLFNGWLFWLSQRAPKSRAEGGRRSR
jgi:hypothetical protein